MREADDGDPVRDVVAALRVVGASGTGAVAERGDSFLLGQLRTAA